MSDVFDAASLERRYAFLDDCPAHLFAQVVTLPDGTLPERVAGVQRWRDALLAGRLPPSGPWPTEAVASPVRKALTELGLVRFCEAQPELVDDLLVDLVAAFARQTDALRTEVTERFRELDALERRRLSAEEDARAQREKREARVVSIDAETLHRLREQAERDHREGAPCRRTGDRDLG
ncbi:MAG: hypothetical protein IPN17_01250 [Deltaproteobacteria bacterium]|nr:hypothetical protein [Deltaproteobacteria bacterium]